MSNLNFIKRMLNLIQSTGNTLSDSVKDLIDECNKHDIQINEINIDTDISNDPIVSKMQYLEILNKVQSDPDLNFESCTVINSEGFSKEILGFIIGYLSGIDERVDILNDVNDYSKSVNEIYKDDKVSIIDNETTKLFMIRKIRNLRTLPKKLNSYLSNSSFTGSIYDFIINGLMCVYGRKPYYCSKETKFTNALIQEDTLL